ncbi:DivIVA domain-containing protein [Calidifontibacter terrae]
MPEPVTPEEIIKIHFTSGPRKYTYDEQAVDDFLDSVVSALRDGTFDPNMAHGALFPTPSGFGVRGYNSAEVDDLLDRIAATPPSSAARSYQPVPAAQPGAGNAPADAPDAVPVELTQSDALGLPDPYEKSSPGLLRRLFRS